MSIVIPMYNVEMYIEKCIMSCINQNIPAEQYEILIIDDGSPDNSLSIVEHLALKYSNIRIISQENQGLSGARNTGLRNAKGDYIWFVDSDDCIKENSLNKIIDQCENEKLDLLAICAAYVDNDNIKRRYSYNDFKILRGIEVLNKGIMIRCVPFTIYRREFLLEHNLTFYPSIYHEDSEFSPRSYYFAKRVGFNNDILYYYDVTTNPNSITHTITHKRFLDRFKIIVSIDAFMRKEVDKADCLFFHNYISTLFNDALSFWAINSSKSIDLEMGNRLICEELFHIRHLFCHLRKSSIIKYKIEGILFTIFPKRTLLVYKLLKLFDFRKCGTNN